jgi:DMSO reductase anchor subunit
VLVCLGFLALTLEAGRPLKGVYLLSNLRSSWISVEVLTGSLFISTAMLDWFSPSPILHIAAFFAALGLIVSHGFIFYRSRAITAWNVPIIPMLFLTSAFVLGGGLLLVLSALQQTIVQQSTFIVVVVCLIADMLAWAMYVLRSRDANFKKTTGFMRRPVSLFLVIGLGHLFPFVTVAGLMMFMGAPSATALSVILIALTGLCMIAGGVSQKIAIILGANFLRGMVMGQSKDNSQTLKPGMNSAGPDVS